MWDGNGAFREGVLAGRCSACLCVGVILMYRMDTHFVLTMCNVYWTPLMRSGMSARDVVVGWGYVNSLRHTYRLDLKTLKFGG